MIRRISIRPFVNCLGSKNRFTKQKETSGLKTRKINKISCRERKNFSVLTNEILESRIGEVNFFSFTSVEIHYLLQGIFIACECNLQADENSNRAWGF